MSFPEADFWTAMSQCPTSALFSHVMKGCSTLPDEAEAFIDRRTGFAWERIRTNALDPSVPQNL